MALLLTQSELDFEGSRRKPEGTAHPSILLFAAGAGCLRLARSLALNLNAKVTCAADERSLADYLRQDTFSALLIEETIAMENAPALDGWYELAGGAMVMEINCGLADASRLTRQVRFGLARWENESRKARAAGMRALQTELNACVTGLLLHSQLALRNAGPEVAPALEHLTMLAETLRERFLP